MVMTAQLGNTNTDHGEVWQSKTNKIVVTFVSKKNYLYTGVKTAY